MNWDYIHRAADLIELIGFLVLLWKGNRAINRIIDIFENFPPHRHENGLILFPKGFEPGVVQRGRGQS